jgi:hypothetical protein
MSDNHDDFLPTRNSLLGRLKDLDDQESWRGFFNTYWGNHGHGPWFVLRRVMTRIPIAISASSRAG